MKYVPTFRFSVGEALRHKRRWLDVAPRKAGPLYRAWAYFDAAINACWMDFYGVLWKDNLILGGDRLMNLLVAFLAASRGESVLILDEPSADDDATRQRFAMAYPGMEDLICQSLRLERNPAQSLDQQLAHALQTLLDSDGEPLVHQLEYATLVHDESITHHSFWVETSGKPERSLGVAPLRLWPMDKLHVFGTELGKCPEFRACFKRIILTASSQYSRLIDIKTPVLAVGDAANPLSNFDYYRGSDRLRELLDTIKVFHHGKNIPASGQHHP